jgi:predicted DNA-binding mobile mystery protein A
MIRRKHKLIIEQLDTRLGSFNVMDATTPPTGGWIKSIRTALNMSLRQLSQRLGTSISSTNEMEQREADGSITIKKLREVAGVLDMKLVYGFVPHEGSLQALIDKRARQLAREIVLRSNQNMRLEDQEVKEERVQKAIEERAEELKNETPRLLWE